MKCVFKNRLTELVLFEGIIVLALGVLMILTPQIASFATAMVIAISIFLYGIYKIVASFLNRSELKLNLLNIFLGLFLILFGIYLFFSPYINLVIITLGLALYFLLESINSVSYTFQTKNKLKYWWLNFFVALLQFVIAVAILIGLPLNSLWLAGLLLGVSFLVAGMGMLSIFLATYYLCEEV